MWTLCSLRFGFALMLVLPYVSILHFSASIRQWTPHSQTPVTVELSAVSGSRWGKYCGFIFGSLKGQNIILLFCFTFGSISQVWFPPLHTFFFTVIVLISLSNCVVVLHCETVKSQINCMFWGWFFFPQISEERDYFFKKHMKISVIFHDSN